MTFLTLLKQYLTNGTFRKKVKILSMMQSLEDWNAKYPNHNRYA